MADTYVLMNRAQIYHWNVEGPGFKGLHDLFEKQYRELLEAVDDIAERIRTLRYYTPGTLENILERSEISTDRVARDSKDILLHTIEGHERLIDRLELAIRQSKEAEDEGTLDLLADRLRAHEKTAWMLKSQAGVSSEELASVTPGKRKTASQPMPTAVWAR